jgi:hypothetical protein
MPAIRYRSPRVRTDPRRLLPIAIALGLAAVVLGSAIGAMPAQIASRWAHLPAALQRELRAHDALWRALTTEQQRAFRARVAQWEALSQATRRERREHWKAWRALPTDQRLQVQAAALAYATLPPDEQQALRAEFAQRDAIERHGWLLGPALGLDFPALTPILLQVPPQQRGPVLAALRAMTPAERIDLAMLAQRTAPQQRDALRRELISTATTNRSAWLRARLDR